MELLVSSCLSFWITVNVWGTWKEENDRLGWSPSFCLLFNLVQVSHQSSRAWRLTLPGSLTHWKIQLIPSSQVLRAWTPNIWILWLSEYSKPVGDGGGRGLASSFPGPHRQQGYSDSIGPLKNDVLLYLNLLVLEMQSTGSCDSFCLWYPKK